MSAKTGYVWDDTTIPYGSSSTCTASPPTGACCPVYQEPTYPTAKRPSLTPDPFLTLAKVFAKIQIALPADNVDYSQTFLDDGTRNALCRPFYGSIFAFDANGNNGANIGTARIIWGGAVGTCLRVLINVPTSFCWKVWHARVGQTSISLGGSFPSFTASNSVWMTGTNNAACGSAVNITLCPDNPGSGVTGTAVAPSAAAWTLPACGQQLFIAFHIAPASTLPAPNLQDGWLVPQTQLGTSVNYDGSDVATPTCANVACNTPFPVQQTISSGSTKVGKVYATSNGNSLSYTFVPQTTSLSIQTVSVYIGTSSSWPKTPTFSYTFGTVPDVSPYQPIPYFSSSSFAVSYDLLRPIAGGGGLQIACNTSYYTGFQIAVQSTSGTSYTATYGPVKAYKCCTAGSLACSTSTPCYPSLKFSDDLGWASVGYEVQTSRCCPLDSVLDVTLALLPEGVNNMNSGLTVGNVGGTCIYGPSGPGTPCTMAVTFLYEGAGYHNTFGYYFYDSSGNGAVDTTSCNSASMTNNDPGLCTLFPDTSMINSGGCLNAGDTLMVTIPAGKQVGWLTRADGAYQSSKWSASKKSGDISNRNIWYSIINPPKGLVNSDGNDSLPPNAPTRHYGWLKIAGTVGNGFVVGTEDLANLGDHDFNDIVYGVKLNGNWSIPGLPSYDPCVGTLLQCKDFVPYDHALYVYTPGCIPYITLDPGVGSTTGKDPTNYYAIPAGWTIAPLNQLTIDTAKTFTTDFWISPCAVGVDTTTGTFQGYNGAGVCGAGSSVTTISDPDDPTGGLCYNVGTAGHMLIMAFQNQDPNCNANTYGQYCDPSKGSYYTVQASANPDYLYIVGLPGVGLPVPVLIPLYNRIQIFTLVDTNSIVTSPVNDASFQMKTVQYLFNNYNAAGYGTGYKAAYVGYGYTTTASPYYNKNCAITSTPAVVANTAICTQPSPAASSANALQALTQILGGNGAAFGWDERSMRFIFVLTARTSAYSGTDNSNFLSALATSGIYVVFLPTSSSAASQLSTVVSGSGGNAVSVTISKPDTTSTAQAAGQVWQQTALTAALPLAGRIQISKATAESAGDVFASNIPVFTIPGMGKTAYPDFQWYTVNPGTTITVPSNYPGGPSPMPKTILWNVLQSMDTTGVAHQFATIISWNVGPNLPGGGATSTFAFSDATSGPYLAQWVDSIRSTLDPNRNLLDIVFTSSVFSPSVPSSGWVQTATGYLGLDNGDVILSSTQAIMLNVRYNILGLTITPIATGYGTWTLKYYLTDGCLQSLPGTVVITMTRTNIPPYCTSQTYSIPYGSVQTVDFSTLVTETPLVNGCQPAPLPLLTGSCTGSPPSGSSTCYSGTDCASTGSNLNVCGSSTLCPTGASTMCSGGSCPTIGLTCVPLTTCATGKICVGKLSCSGGTGCPAGFQNGLYCLVSNSATQSVCCAMSDKSSAQIGFLNDLSASFGTVKYNSGGTWTNVLYGANNANNAYLSSQFAGLSGISGTNTWNYVVVSASSKKSTQCSITLTIGPSNRPPVISVSTMPLITEPGTVGTYQVTITDPDLNDVEQLLVSYNGYTVQWNYINPSNFGVSTPGLGPNPILTSSSASAPVLTNLALSGTGTITFNMQWQPLLTHPYGVDSTFRLQAKDAAGATSNYALVDLGIPDQQPPSCLAVSVPSHKQYDQPFTITLSGTSPNVQDQTKLDITFTTLPTKGTLTLTKGTSSVTVVKNTLYPAATWGTASGSNTNYVVSYAPGIQSGADSFTVRYSNSGNQQSASAAACTVNIQLDPVPTPPKTNDVFATSVRAVPLSVNIPGQSVDGTLISLTIATDPVLTSGATLTFNGATVAKGQTYTLAAAASSATWTFVYTNPNFAGSTGDTFQYYVTDTNSLSSGSPQKTPNTATIIQGVVQQPPVTQAGSGTTQQNTDLPITLVWGGVGGAGSWHYADPDSTQAQQTLKITSLPSATAGVLKDSNGVPIPASGLWSTSNRLIFSPATNFVGNAQFSFQTTDSTSLTSNVSPYDIVINVGKTPPFITLDPPSIQVARGSTGTFKITTWDINSNTINVYIDQTNMPYTCARAPGYSNETNPLICSAVDIDKGPVYAPTGTQSFTTQPPSGMQLLTTIDNTGQWGTQWNIILTWKPNYKFYTDSRTGTFQVQATNVYGTSSNKPVGAVSVVPNIVPVPTGPSSYSWSQNAGNLPVSLSATDANSYHDPYLSFTLVTVPDKGVKLVSPGDATQTALATGATFGFAPSNGADSVVSGGSKADLVVVFPNNFHDTVTYSFTATDLLSGVSAIKVVTITVAHVNQPPAVSNVTIIVYEASCALSSCGTIQAPVYASSSGNATITTPTIVGSDPDLVDIPTETLTFRFDSLPTKGVLVYNGAAITSGTSTAYPSAPSSPQWTVYYQPSGIGEYTPGCTSVTTCLAQAPYAVVPYTVKDAGSPSPVLQAGGVYNIYIIHVPHPPVTYDYVYEVQYMVSQDVQITGTSVDGTLDTITFTAENLQAMTTIQIYDSTGTLHDLVLDIPYPRATYGVSGHTGSSGNWKLRYYTEQTADFVETITYLVTTASPDSLSSVEHNTTFYKGVTLLPPLARGDDFTTAQDTQLTIPFHTAATENMVKGEHRYSSQDPNTRIRITSLPSNGKLLNPTTGAVVVVGNVLSASLGSDIHVVYVPSAGYSGADFFNFKSLDANGLLSSEATDSITITPVNYPPTINILPSTRKVARNNSATFSITVSDVDSPRVTVKVTDLLDEWVTNSYGQLQLTRDVDGATLGQWEATGPTLSGTFFVLDQAKADYGKLWTYTLSWTPSISTPDSTSGTIALLANDGEADSPTNPSAYAVVLPNDPPTATGAASYTVTQGTTSLLINLPGIDPQPYHDKVLKINSLSQPDQPGTSITTPASFQATSGAGTLYTTTLKLSPSFTGTTTFTYSVVDLLGLASNVASISVTVTAVNQPPTTTPPTIVVPQDSCMQGSCPSGETPNEPKELPCSDPEGGAVHIVPSPPALGTGGVLNVSSGDVVIINGGAIDGACPYTIYYQPPPGLVSDCILGFDSVTGKGCKPVTYIPVTVCDDQNLCVNTQVPVIVTPVAHPPVTQDITAVGREYTFLPPGSDPDNDIQYIEIKTVSIADPSTTTLKFKLNGQDIVPGLRFNGASVNPVWPFEYKNTGVSAISDSFTWVVVDSLGAESNVGTGKITADPIVVPPSAYGDTYQTTPGATIPIALDYGPPGTGSNLWNPSGSASTTSVIIVSVPSEGQLFPSTNPTTPVKAGDVLPPGTTLIYTAGPDGGSPSFDFQATDEATPTGTSPSATIIINVIPPPLPPVITMDPVSITVVRGQSTPVFNVEAWAPSASSFDVIFTLVNVPWGSTVVPLTSKFNVRRTDGSVLREWSVLKAPEPLPVIGDTVSSFSYPSKSQWGTHQPFQISWTPSYFAPDGTKGSFSLQVVDNNGLVSNIVTGTLALEPNLPPSVIDNPTGPSYYSKTFEQGSWSTTPITLRGADPDPWDCSKLTFQITDGPDFLNLAASNDPLGVDPIRGSNLETFSPITSPVSGSCDTISGVNLIPVDPNWSGTDTFTFVTIDTFGRVSPPQVVTVTVTPVPHAPVSEDYVIYTYQNACVFAYCGATPDQVAAMNNAHIVGSDIDDGQSATLTLVWEDLPTTGQLATYIPNAPGTDVSLFDLAPQPLADGWKHTFWYQPDKDVTSKGCDKGSFNNCEPLSITQFHFVDSTGLKSPTYNLTIYVTPVNQPPYSNNLEFTINQGESLIIYYDDKNGNKIEKLPATDPDTPDNLILAQFRGTAVTNKGSWTDSAGSTFGSTSASNNAGITGRFLTYTPGPTDVSDPVTDPVGYAYFRVYDDGPLYSPDYYIKVWILPTPQPVEWVGPREITTTRRTPVLINLNIPQYWKTTDTKATPRFTLPEAPELGTFYVIDDTVPGGVRNITEFPFVPASGSFFYLPPFEPLPNWNPDTYIVFPFKLEMLDPNGTAHEISTTNIDFTVHVLWLNDPPVIIPLWQPQEVPMSNAFDEDTFIRVKFTGDDTDGLWPHGLLLNPRKFPLLRGQIQTMPEDREAKVYACDPVLHGPGGTGKKDCSDGAKLSPLDFLPTWNDPQVNVWEVSVVGAPNYNGIVRLNFVVWDEDLAFSSQGTCVINILPINDYPSIVKDNTFCDLVRYQPDNDKKCYHEVSYTPKGTKITIKDGAALDQKLLQGQIINKPVTTTKGAKSTQATATADDDKLLLINKCTTVLQDIDFTFNYKLNITGQLYQATFMNPLDLVDCDTGSSSAAKFTASQKRTESTTITLSQQSPRTGNTDPTRMSYSGDITALNQFLSVVSFLVVLDAGMTSGFGLFVITDYGNIDKWNRPLETTFTIEYSAPVPLAAGTVPVAVIALLPIVAAAVSAIAAAAWLMLGQRAAEAVTQNFDAFAPTQAGQGNLSPCYNDAGWDATNPMPQ